MSDNPDDRMNNSKSDSLTSAVPLFAKRNWEHEVSRFDTSAVPLSNFHTPRATAVTLLRLRILFDIPRF